MLEKLFCQRDNGRLGQHSQFLIRRLPRYQCQGGRAKWQAHDAAYVFTGDKQKRLVAVAHHLHLQEPGIGGKFWHDTGRWPACSLKRLHMPHQPGPVAHRHPGSTQGIGNRRQCEVKLCRLVKKTVFEQVLKDGAQAGRAGPHTFWKLHRVPGQKRRGYDGHHITSLPC